MALLIPSSAATHIENGLTPTPQVYMSYVSFGSILTISGHIRQDKYVQLADFSGWLALHLASS